jgi:hypothetical protein
LSHWDSNWINAYALPPLLFSFASEYAKNQVGLKLNWIHQLLAYAYGVNLLGYKNKPKEKHGDFN